MACKTFVGSFIDFGSHLFWLWFWPTDMYKAAVQSLHHTNMLMSGWSECNRFYRRHETALKECNYHCFEIQSSDITSWTTLYPLKNHHWFVQDIQYNLCIYDCLIQRFVKKRLDYKGGGGTEMYRGHQWWTGMVLSNFWPHINLSVVSHNILYDAVRILRKSCSKILMLDLGSKLLFHSTNCDQMNWFSI